MTTPRTPLRNDDIQGGPRDMQRPLNEALRGISGELASLPRRQQAWVRVPADYKTVPFELAPPGYAVACVNLLAALNDTGAVMPQTGALGLRVVPADGSGPPRLIVAGAYGLDTVTGLNSMLWLVEFVEDTTGGVAANDGSVRVR